MVGYGLCYNRIEINQPVIKVLTEDCIKSMLDIKFLL